MVIPSFHKNSGKIAIYLGGCPSQVLFCPRLILGLSKVCLHMSLLVFFCPSNVCVLPLFCPGLAIESAQYPFDVLDLDMTFFWRRLMVGL